MTEPSAADSSPKGYEKSYEKDYVNKGAIAWMANNPIAANLLMIILLCGGIFSALTIQKEVFPAFELDVVQVRVAYPGASPEEVEQSILQPIEEAIQGVEGIREMTSTAQEGSGNVSIELVAGVDRMKAYQEIDQAVNRVRTFPNDAEEPEVALQTRQRSVMDIGIYGNADIWELRKLAERLRDRLLNHESITQIELSGTPDFVTHIDISQDALREYGLTMAQVSAKIRESASDVPAGAIESSNGEILLRLKERKQWAEAYEQIVLLTSDDGAVVRLADIASVEDGFERVGYTSQFNRQPSVEVSVYRIGDQSPLEISAAVSEILTSFNAEVPEGIHTRIDSNSAEDFSDRLFLLLENGAIAIVIVLCILGIFLELKLAFWVMMGMTISFVGGVLFLPMIDVSINMISMFAFLVVLGIVVDDAVVVGENIYQYRQEGLDFKSAAIKGCQDIATPVTFTILTTIVAFLPVMFIPGTTGKFWWPLPAVVIIVLLISLVEALYILPAHLAHSRNKPKRGIGLWVSTQQKRFARAFEHFVHHIYKPVLQRCLAFRYVTLCAGLALLTIVGAFSYSDHMGMIMMPQLAADEIEAGVRLPVGTTREQAAKVANEITDATHRMFEEHNLYRVAEGIKSNVRGKSFIDVEIVLLPPDERDMSAAQIIQLWRDEIGDIQGVNQIVFEAERGPGGWRDDISIDLSHTDTDMLVAASQALVEQAESFVNTRDVNDSYNKGKQQYDLTLRPEGALLGLSPQEVGRQVRNAFYGAIALRQLRGTNEIEVRVKLEEQETKQLHTLEDFMLQLPSGGQVPLMDVVDVKVGEAFSNLNRRNGRRIINVGMDVEPQSATTRVLEVLNNEVLTELRQQYPGLTWSFRGSQAEMRQSTAVLWGGFGMAIFMIYALLAVAFKSYVQPLIVMCAIPFGLVGAVIGHLLLGYDLSIVSLMGVVALAGVVVNDTLIMVDFANKKRTTERAVEAIVQAGTRRFRPIILTTLTTFGGLAPIILETSNQATQLIPMAISLGFGIVFATAIILIIVPCLYLIVEDILTCSNDKKQLAQQQD